MTSSWRLQDVLRVVFKTSSRRLCKASSRRLQNIFKTSWKTKDCYAEDVLKTSSRRVQDQKMFAGIYLGKKQLITVQIFQIFECSGQNLLILYGSSFASIFIFVTHNSPVKLTFKLIYFLLYIKGSHQSSNFENFMCSGKNLAICSCHFWKRMLIFLQILHQCPVPSDLTLLYLF